MPQHLKSLVPFALAVLGLAVVQPFRSTPAAQNPDMTKELLAEVRGLRVAMEQLASAGPRVQLMFGRTDINRLLDDLDRSLSRR